MYVNFSADGFNYNLKLFNRYNILECYKNEKLYYSCDILDGRVPEESIMLAKKILREGYEGGEILDIGAGTGILLLELCKKYRIQKCIGVEIDKRKCDYARKNIYNNNLEKRCCLFEGSYKNIPYESLSKVQIIVSNPPLIPDELGFWEKDLEGGKAPIYENILNWVINTFSSNIKVYLHVFDYIGITQRTGANKCLYEIAQDLGFNIKILDSVHKKITTSSSVLKKRKDIARVYPMGYVIKGGTKIRFEQFKGETINSDENVLLPCSFICFMKL